MADDLFEHPRLATIYDALDPDRSDLGAYVDIAMELGARSVLDVGCGTGTLACLLANRGIDVVGVDPALASLEVARAKPGAESVRWIHGTLESLPPLAVDLATMTANVAQVFLTDADFDQALWGISGALAPGGHLAFEVRDPARRAWNDWKRERTYSSAELDGVGRVESWCDLVDVGGECVSFRWTHVFARDGAVLASASTLRFRSREAIEERLHDCGFLLREVREAPDRPGRELVFVASVPRDGAG